MGWGKSVLVCVCFLNKNKKNTLKSFSLKEVDKSLTTKFPAYSPPPLLAGHVSGAQEPYRSPHSKPLSTSARNAPISYHMFR